jgi:hypothetical protein
MSFNNQHQGLSYLHLTADHDAFFSGQIIHIDPLPAITLGEIKTMVDNPLASHWLGYFRVPQQVHHPLFKHPVPNRSGTCSFV